MKKAILELTGFTLVEILIVIGIVAGLAAAVIPSGIRARVNAHDALAQNTLQVMSKATEIFYVEKNGSFPTDMTDLTSPDPAYINTNYCDESQIGFDYTCINLASGYTYIATPSTIGFSGSTIFTITTGGILSSGGGSSGSGAIP